MRVEQSDLERHDYEELHNALLAVFDAAYEGELPKNPWERVRGLAQWHIGCAEWAESFKAWCEFVGLTVVPAERGVTNPRK